jgi:hypothetical protein
LCTLLCVEHFVIVCVLPHSFFFFFISVHIIFENKCFFIIENPFFRYCWDGLRVHSRTRTFLDMQQSQDRPECRVRRRTRSKHDEEPSMPRSMRKHYYRPASIRDESCRRVLHTVLVFKNIAPLCSGVLGFDSSRRRKTNA